MARNKATSAVNALTESQTMLLQVGFAAACLLVAIYGSPPMAERLSRLPIKGFVNEVQPEIGIIENPQALPGAMAAPAEGRLVSEPDLALLDDLFVPSEPLVDEGALRETQRREQVRAQLASVTVAGVSNSGAFINGRYISSGTPIGMFVSGTDGNPVPVIARIRGNSVHLVAGEFEHVIELRK